MILGAKTVVGRHRQAAQAVISGVGDAKQGVKSEQLWQELRSGFSTTGRVLTSKI